MDVPSQQFLESLPHPSPLSCDFPMGGEDFQPKFPLIPLSTFTPSRVNSFSKSFLQSSPGSEEIPPGHGLDQVIVPQNTLGSGPALVPQEPDGSRSFHGEQDPGKGSTNTRE